MSGIQSPDPTFHETRATILWVVQQLDIADSAQPKKALSIYQTLCLMRGWGLDMRLRTSWLCMVAKFQTTRQHQFILPGKDMQLQPDPREVSSPSQQYTVYSPSLLVGSLVLTPGCLPLHRAVRVW